MNDQSKQAPSRPWTEEDINILKSSYPHEKTEQVATDLGRTVRQVYDKAARLELSKTPEYLDSVVNPFVSYNKTGLAKIFEKGRIPWNKGMKGFDAGGKSHATRFSKGNRTGKAHPLYQPVGSERFTKEGYLQRKVNDGASTQNRWKSVHVLVWESVNGKVPKGHKIVFRDGDKSNIVVENLELISDADLMRRNTIHNLPKDLVEVIQLNREIKKEINGKDK